MRYRNILDAQLPAATIADILDRPRHHVFNLEKMGVLQGNRANGHVTFRFGDVLAYEALSKMPGRVNPLCDIRHAIQQNAWSR